MTQVKWLSIARWVGIVLALIIIPSCSASCTWLAYNTYAEIQLERSALRQLWQAHQPQAPQPPRPPQGQ